MRKLEFRVRGKLKKSIYRCCLVPEIACEITAVAF